MLISNHLYEAQRDWDVSVPYFILGAQLCMFLLIATVNLLSLVVIAVTPKLQNIHHQYIAALAMSDLQMAFNQVLAIPWLSQAYHHHFEASSNLCLAFKCLQHVSGLASLFTIVLIAIDRLFYIRHPFWYLRVVTKNKVRIAIAFVWVLSLVTALCIRLVPYNTPYPGCDAYSVMYESDEVGYVHGVLYFLICFAVFISYGIVIRTAIRQAKAIQCSCSLTTHVISQSQPTIFLSDSHHGKLDVSLNLKIVQKMVGVFAVLFVCWTPYCVLGVIGPRRFSQEVLLITGVLAAFNSFANYAVYALADREFRNATAEILGCRKKLPAQAGPFKRQREVDSFSEVENIPRCNPALP